MYKSDQFLFGMMFGLILAFVSIFIAQKILVPKYEAKTIQRASPYLREHNVRFD